MKKKSAVTMIAAVLAVLAVLAIAFAVGADIAAGKETVKHCEHSISYYYKDDEGSTRFFYDDRLLSGSVAGYVSAFLTCDGTVGIFSAGTELYRVSEAGIVKIFPAGVLRAVLSLDNSTIVFTTATQLHIYKSSTDSIETVKPEGISGIPSIAVSNDGATAAYTVKTTDGKYLTYVYENGESRLAAENAYVLAVGSGAKNVWYVDPANSALYNKKGSSARKVAENVSGLVEFNRDLTEAIFDVSGVTNYSKNGSRAKVLVENASVFTTKPECAATNGGDSATGSVADCSTLFNCVFYTPLTSSRDQTVKVYNLYYVDRFCRSRELAIGAEAFAVYGNKLAVTVDRVLYIMNSDDPGTAKTVARDVYSFSVKKNGELYILSLDKTLSYYTDGTKIPLAENVIHQVLAGDRCLFLKDYSKTGKLMLADGRLPLVVVNDSTAHVSVKPGSQFLYTDIYENSFGTKVCDVYSSSDGLNFTLALEGVVFPGAAD
ncbi:MAG: hypothetical protein K6F68_08180 [Clostridiales bacterium]|nr:hypothetical protein [Clostridiales bacterium]